MKIKIILILVALFISRDVWADESDIIQADRKALEEAFASRSSSKILAAREQLSDDLGREADQRRKDMEGVVIPLVPDGHGHFIADVIINNTAHASLIVDTGSPVVLLTNSFIKKLGLDVSQAQLGYVELLNGKYKAAGVVLDGIKIGKATAQGVSAAVLLEKADGINDGLLGMSFLSKFHFTLDQTNQKLILRSS